VTQPYGLAGAASLEELYATTFHQLRAPLSSINGYASLMLTGELGRLKPRQREPMERIQEICGSLTGTIGNLLALAKANVQRLNSAKSFVDVPEVAREVIRSLQGEIRRKKLRFVQQLPVKPVRLWADSGDLAQIFLNLLSNAVKFTPVKETVRVAVVLKDQNVLIEVSDTGVGISPGDLPKIFEEFYHVDHPETGAGSGSGLGLAIVKRVVDAYGGEIKVSSHVGRGTSFRVLLPIRTEEEVLGAFFEETWAQAKQEGKHVGFILLQVRRTATGAHEKAAAKRLALLEQALKDCLRKEDRIFHIPRRQLLTVLVKVSREEFTVLTQRLERTVRDSAARGSNGVRQPVSWRWMTVLVPLRGSPARFLELAQRRLARAWKSSVRDTREG